MIKQRLAEGQGMADDDPDISGGIAPTGLAALVLSSRGTVKRAGGKS
jgi:hypothetical protein